jgi:TonB family protein
MKRERVHLPDPLSTNKQHRADDDPINDFIGMSFEEKPIWAGLYESFRDAVFPPKLPPLELTSTPIPTPDRMAVKTNPWAIGTATIANGGVLAILILMGLTSTINHLSKSPQGDKIRLSDFPLFAPASTQPAGGSDGGGSNELMDPIKGRLPKREEMPITPPQVPILDNPRLAIDSAIAVPLDIKLPDNPSLANIGVHNSPNVMLASNGPGNRGGIGTGSDGGDGPGNGNGGGPGSDRGFGNSIYTPGIGGVSNPIPIVSPEAEFSDEARRNKYQGICLIAVIVDARGYPQNPRVIRSLGIGLDEKALEAVQRYRFRPAMKDGKPVAAMISVQVDFRLFLGDLPVRIGNCTRLARRTRTRLSGRGTAIVKKYTSSVAFERPYVTRRFDTS